MKNSKELCINQFNFKIDFTICTLVTNLQEYQEMVVSFNNAGFTKENSEFLYIDNSDGNTYDGYSGLNKFLNIAIGKYIIICHQDILLNFDNIDKLKQCITEMDTIDSDWGVLGNAGFYDTYRKLYCITDPWGENQRMGNLPSKAKSLDENFLVVKNEANLALSHNLKGFHLYAADLCTIASILGWNAYVIDFHLFHKSAGNLNESFFSSKKAFIDKYSNHVKSFTIPTTCTLMIITGYSFLNRFLNKNFFYRVKQRLDFLFK